MLCLERCLPLERHNNLTPGVRVRYRIMYDQICHELRVISIAIAQYMQLLPRPAYSPDMSPIKHVWDLVGRCLARDPCPAASKDELLLRMQFHAEIVEVEIVVSPSIVHSENFAELNRTITCMVLKASDRRTSSPCHDEFRGLRSDYVRQEALETTTTATISRDFSRYMQPAFKRGGRNVFEYLCDEI
ncbi:hypothetical protein TNCV_2533701 [Trichonephila clavipes]|nr:hypothetical protein TNCV_2533701 [Trichonephila clavipes]